MTIHKASSGRIWGAIFLPLALFSTAGTALADTGSLSSQQPSPSQANVFEYSDEFNRPNSDQIGKSWIDCHSIIPSSFEPLAILDEGIVVTDPQTRPGVYDTPPPSGHPPTDNRIYPGIGCAFMETGIKQLSVKVMWSGNHGVEREPPVSHVEGSPLLFVSPDNPRYAFGAWITEMLGRTAIIAGYIGSPPERFEPIATGLLEDHKTGTPREVEIRVTATGEATIWVDGEQVSFYQGFGLNPIPIDKALLESTLHGFALDAHYTNPIANIPNLKGIESIQIKELR